MVSSPQRIVRCVLAVPFLMVVLGAGRQGGLLWDGPLTTRGLLVLRLLNRHPRGAGPTRAEPVAAGDRATPWRAVRRGARPSPPQRSLHVPQLRPGTAPRDSRPLAPTRQKGNVTVKIGLTSILVDDQDRALRFYTDVL